MKLFQKEESTGNTNPGDKSYLRENEHLLRNNLEQDDPETPVTVIVENKEAPLGTVTPKNIISEEDKAKLMSMGYVDVDEAVLPSKGDYNPKDIKIQVRPASLEEIKHFSAMREEERDAEDVSQQMYVILEKCYQITQGGKSISVKNLQEKDKLFLLFYLRDISMAGHHRQNKLYQTVPCPHCGKINKIELVNDIFSYYTIAPGIMKYYSSEERCFVVPIPGVDTLKLYIPSIGTQMFLQKYIMEQEKKKREGENGFYNMNFLKYVQFLVSDYSVLNSQFIEREYSRFQSWPFDKHEAIRLFTEKINIGLKPSITFNCSNKDCCKEITSVLRFPEGIRNLFNLSSVASGLFED